MERYLGRAYILKIWKWSISVCGRAEYSFTSQATVKSAFSSLTLEMFMANIDSHFRIPCNGEAPGSGEDAMRTD
eukprot:scaffold205776_cov43-Prasinocladus_malaysianus.AAC.2